MLTPHQQSTFAGYQWIDGWLLALYVDKSGSHRAVEIGPVPAWAAVCDWCDGTGGRREEVCDECDGTGRVPWERQE